MLWEHDPLVNVSTANFEFSQTFSSVSITQCKYREHTFLFLLQNTATKKRKSTSLLGSSKCKFSLLVMCFY